MRGMLEFSGILGTYEHSFHTKCELFLEHRASSEGFKLDKTACDMVIMLWIIPDAEFNKQQ